MKKPNQMQDEVTKVIYPPSEAIVPQLSAIRANAISAINVYENTEDIHSIFPNLKMMQEGIDYLRGLPEIEIPEDPKPPEDTLKPGIWASEEVKSAAHQDDDGTYIYTITGTDIEPSQITEELFGTLPIDVLEIGLQARIECNHPYTITQYNPVLEYYEDNDPFVGQDINGNFVKIKDYLFTDDDELEYKFLVPSGRNEIKIYIDDANGEVGKFKFITHVHFRKPTEGANQ